MKTLLDYYRAIEIASLQMLDAAQKEDWHRMMRLEGSCMVLIAQLRFKAWISTLRPTDCIEKNRIMQNILRTDAGIRLLAEPWIRDIEPLTRSAQGEQVSAL